MLFPPSPLCQGWHAMSPAAVFFRDGRLFISPRNTPRDAHNLEVGVRGGMVSSTTEMFGSYGLAAHLCRWAFIYLDMEWKFLLLRIVSGMVRRLQKGSGFNVSSKEMVMIPRIRRCLRKLILRGVSQHHLSSTLAFAVHSDVLSLSARLWSYHRQPVQLGIRRLSCVRLYWDGNHHRMSLCIAQRWGLQPVGPQSRVARPRCRT